MIFDAKKNKEDEMKLFSRKKKAKEEKPEVRMEFKVAGVTFDNDDGKKRKP